MKMNRICTCTILLTLPLTFGWLNSGTRSNWAQRSPSLLTSPSKLSQPADKARVHWSTRSDENRPTSIKYPPRTGGSTKKSNEDMLRFIETPIGSTVGDQVGGAFTMDNDLIRQLEKIVKAADARKAQDLVVLCVGHVSTMTQALVICSGNSRPQNQAIANSVQQEMKDELVDRPLVLPDGNPNSGWMVLDYGSIMVHIMTPKSRLFYNVEGQWRSKGGKGFRPDLMEQWTMPETSLVDYVDDAATTSPEDDPFWS